MSSAAECRPFCLGANEIRYQYVYYRQKLGIYIYIHTHIYIYIRLSVYIKQGGGGGGGGLSLILNNSIIKHLTAYILYESNPDFSKRF